MEKHRWPRSRENKMKPNFLQHFLAMLFPETPTVRVTVQGKNQLDDWILELTMPTFRPALFGQSDPSLGAFQLRLRVGLFAVGLLTDVTWHVPVGIQGFTCFHGSGTGSQLTE